jgi:protein tyrosine phosphatase type IVA
MDSPEKQDKFEVNEQGVITDPISISTLPPPCPGKFVSSSVPNTRSHSFIVDSSDKSADDSSSVMTSNKSFASDDEEEDEEDFKSYKKKQPIPEPVIYTSSISSGASSTAAQTSPTSVYATMLGANNIVNNSMNILQAGARLPNPPTLIEYAGFKFLIMDAPSQSNLHLYLKEMERVGVKDIVRICEPTYPREIVESCGIKVHDWVFPDGESPPVHIIESWLRLVDSQKHSDGTFSGGVAVHCVAGLGRAPVLVAIALIENGMKALDAVMYIRQRRRGAINNKQLKFLENYHPRHLKKDKCQIM